MMRSAVRHLMALLALLPMASPASESLHEEVEINDEVVVEIRHFPAREGDFVLLGFPCDQGTGMAEAQAGEVLSEHGLDVWLADLLGAHFLPVGPTSMRSLEGEDVAQLIEHTHRLSGKRVVLIASGFGAIPTLRGARDWQVAHPDSEALAGAILFFPVLTAKQPDPGQPIEYVPVVDEVAIPIVIMQPGNSPTRFWVNQLAKRLRDAGSLVKVEVLPKVRSRFYSRADASEEELATARRLPELVEQAIETLITMESSQ